MKSKRGNTATIVVVILAMLGSLIMFWDFTDQIKLNLDQQSQITIEASLDHSQEMIKQKLEDTYAYLDAMAVALSSLDSLSDTEISSILKLQNEAQQFTRLVVITPDGQTHAVGIQTENVADTEYFRASLAGERSVSSVIDGLINGQKGIALSVPIKRDGAVIGVLRCDYLIDQINDLFILPVFERKGSVNLMSADGTIITNRGGVEGYSNYFDALRQVTLKDGMTVAQFQDDLASGRRGILNFTYQDKDRTISYAPAEVCDWYILISVPPDLNNAQLDHFSNLGLIMLAKFSIVICLVVLYPLWSQRRSNVALRESEQTLEALANNIPGGAFRYSVEGIQQFDYVSEGLYRLFDCTRNEFLERTGNRFSQIVYEADRKRVFQEIDEQIRSNGSERVEYRIQTKDGSIRWVYDQGQLVTDERGKRWLYAVLVDVTSQHEAQEEVLASEERYRLIMEKSDNIIYEWNMENDTVIVSDVWQKKLGYMAPRENFLEEVKSRDIIHPDYIEPYLSMLHNARQGKNYQEMVLMVKRGGQGDHYIWMRTSLMTLHRDNRKADRAVGIFVDINREIAENERLRVKSQRDALTQLYNKETTGMMISEYLSSDGQETMNAFLIIDLDNFKGINDSYGHLTGDTLLEKAAQRIYNCFRAEDIVGRIGGDEFVVFIKNLRGREIAEQKARMLCKRFDQPFQLEDRSFKTSCSIGIAFFSDDGTYYEELYERADIALYQAKRSGKNRYQCYEAGSHDGSVTPRGMSVIESDG